jgi:hypothetical protein
MAFKEGESGNPNGRPKGSVNKLTSSFKELVKQTYEQLEESGQGMKAWAEENPTAFYNIAAKLIPTEIQAKVESTKPLIINWSDQQQLSDGNNSNTETAGSEKNTS